MMRVPTHSRFVEIGDEDLSGKRLNTNINWNVIDENSFKERIYKVFNAVSNALSHTLGPYGSTTIIEKFGEMHITKDGWQVLKGIRFDDPIDNNILMLLTRISAQVILKVGDGSTSSIVAANTILQEMMRDDSHIKDIRPKEFMTLLNTCVGEITDRIYKNATPIDKDTYDTIYKLAYVSTNGDANIASIIRDIYRETKNPAIEYVKSKTDKTYYEIIEGYKLPNMTFIDTIFTTNDSGTCVVEKPLFLMFDHKLDIETSLPIIGAGAQIAAENKRRLIVVAPAYDKFLLEHIQKTVMGEYRTKGASTVIYARVSLINNVSHDLFNDFAVMTGGEIIREKFIDNLRTYTEEIDDYVPNYDAIQESMGAVEHVEISQSATTIRGFEKRNPTLYAKIVENANSKYNQMEQDYRDRGLVDMKLNELKGRVTKLKGSMGVIYVGGYSTLEKTANFDLVEDAVKACESADMYGYNCGGNLVIPYTICQILDDYANGVINTNSTFMMSVYSVLAKAFIEVFHTVLRNKWIDAPAKKLDEITDLCIKGDRLYCYDLVSENLSNDVINSCITDIEILKAATSIVSLLVSSNQYISINTPEK